MPLPPLPALVSPSSLRVKQEQLSPVAAPDDMSDKSRKRPRAQLKDKENQTPRRDALASPSTSSDAGRPRKPTYLLQREERDVLADEVRAMEARLEELKMRVGLPTKKDEAAVVRTQTHNFDLEEHIHTTRLYLTRIQTMVMRELHESPVNPLNTFIHLPQDMEARRTILRSMRDAKLRRAEQVAIERLHDLDHTQSHLSEEQFMTDDGHFHCHRFEINAFDNFRSARQLYDAVVAFLYNWDVSVGELLNQLAIREDSPDEFDPTIWNPRIVTVTEDIGCTEELNTVFFARFRGDQTSEAVGVITGDTVDEDDLYPYRPHERTSKRGQSAYLIYEIPRPGYATPLVVLKSCLFMTQLPAQFELAPGAEDKLRANIPRWPIAMVKFLRSFNGR